MVVLDGRTAVLHGEPTAWESGIARRVDGVQGRALGLVVFRTDQSCGEHEAFGRARLTLGLALS